MEILVALRFLTILPLPGRAAVSERQLGRATAWYPLAGVVLGLVQAALLWFGNLLFGPLAAATAAVAAGVVLTRGLHLDGLADSFDSLGGATRERRLQIMKDSRVGVFGVLAIVLCLLLKTVFLAEVAAGWTPRAGAVAQAAPLAAVAVLGRWAMLLTLFCFPPAAREGLGFAVKQHCRWPQALLGTVTAVAWCWLTAGPRGLAGIALTACVAGLVGLLAARRLGGLTGDSHGAACELSELAALAALAVAAHIGVPV